MRHSQATNLLFLLTAAATVSANPTCESLATADMFKNTAIASSQVIGADATKGIAAHCEVVGVVTPVPGSRIGVVYRLPAHWNGKLLGLGGGGWAGNVRLDTALPGLSSGYATAQTDAGHAGTGPWDTSWTASPEAVTDFAFRAIHLMTEVGKAVVAAYYGRPYARAFFQGCSTGGRQGLMEVQRFPDDYDGVIAGAPVHTLQTQTTALLRNQAFATAGAALTPEQHAHLSAAALAACDASDGLQDGIVTDPRACRFDPGALACKADAQSASCLSAAQIAAVRAVYRGVRTSDGRIASYPLSRGSESGWSRFVNIAPKGDSGLSASGAGMAGMRALLFNDPNFDLEHFNADKDLATVRGTSFALAYEARNPDITAFVRRGGKLFLWHGFDDPGPSPLATIEYYEAVDEALGHDAQDPRSNVRLFLAPGVQHCRGGPGADVFDALTALDRWVENNEEPSLLLATRADGKLSRPLCRYPALPRYKGSGDVNEARNFDCRT